MDPLTDITGTAITLEAWVYPTSFKPNIWEGTIAHELLHHWFGDLVTTESWANLTVNESFATYSVYLWYEHKYGKDKAAAP